MELCTDDEEASCFFVFFFLQWLPAWLHIQLEGDDQDDIRLLAMKADPLFALHGHKKRAVAVVESQEDEDEAADINAVQGGPQRGNCRHSSQQGGQRGGQQGGSGQGARVGASSREGRWQGLDAERGGGGRLRNLLEPLVVRREGVSLQGRGGVSLWLAGKLVAWECLNAVGQAFSD